MTWAIARLPMLAFCLLTALPAGANPSADALQACMEANVPPAARINRFTMTTVTEDRSETLIGKMFLRQAAGERAMTLQIEAPSHYRDSAFLFVERDGTEQMYIYLSATGRVRQISGASMDGAFFGSAFRYSDLRKAVGLMGAAQPQRLPDQTYQDGPAATLRLATTETAGGLPPPLSTLLVEPERCVPLYLRVERDATLLREFIGARSDLASDQGRWYLAKGQMIDHERSVSTEVQLGELRGFESIPGSLFSRSSFYQAVFNKK